MPKEDAKKIAKKEIIAKMKAHGHRSLSQAECCDLVIDQLEAIAVWQRQLWDVAYGGGGGGSPPPPPPWPPS